MALCLVYSGSLWWMVESLIGNNEAVIGTSFAYQVGEMGTRSKCTRYCSGSHTKDKSTVWSVVTEKVALSQLKNVAIYITPFHSCPGQKFVINTKSSVVRLISFS